MYWFANFGDSYSKIQEWTNNSAKQTNYWKNKLSDFACSWTIFWIFQVIFSGRTCVSILKETYVSSEFDVNVSLLIIFHRCYPVNTVLIHHSKLDALLKEQEGVITDDSEDSEQSENESDESNTSSSESDSSESGSSSDGEVNSVD